MRATAEQLHGFKNMARQYLEFSEYLNAWRSEELEKLPFANNENLDVLRGRVQALTEMQRLLDTRV